jgi:hypothetical protein
MQADALQMGRRRARVRRSHSPEPAPCPAVAAIPDVMDASVSAAGLQNTQPHTYLNDFELIVGERSYYCPKYVADFISPKILALHGFDPTLGSYAVEIPDGDDMLGSFLAIGHGPPLWVTKSDCEFSCGLCQELGNSELLAIIRHQLSRSLTMENCTEQYEICIRTGDALESIIEFVAQISTNCRKIFRQNSAAAI